MIRINKYLARCGVASRRSADSLVLAGRVTVNGATIDTPGFSVDEEKDDVRVDNKPVKPVPIYVYAVLNKPAGYVTTLSDPHHEKTVLDLILDIPERIYPVGRLDMDTEGVLLFTNDGEMAHRLTHPKYKIIKTYQAQVNGVVPEEKLVLFSNGIELPDGATGHATARIESVGDNTTELILELTEGRKREVKHLCKAIGHPVLKLTRIDFAGITCRDLPIGHIRYLTDTELADLRRQIKM